MYPDSIEILGNPIRIYLIAYSWGFLLASILALILTREMHPNHPLRDLFAVSIVCIVTDLTFTPGLVWILAQFNLWLPLNWSLGQILAAFIGLASYHALARKHVSITFAQRLDLLAAPMMLFIAAFRLGCLAAGCCYGVPAPDLPWAITFTNPHAVSIYKNIPVHPTQLYESIGAIAIWGSVMALRKHPKWQGSLMVIALFLYGSVRFIIEFYRGDARPMIGVLSINQIICILMIFIGGSVLWRSNHRLIQGTRET